MDYSHIAKLVQQYNTGDRSAFDKIYSLLYNSQYYYVYKMTRDRFAAEDITQEVFISVYRFMDKIKDPKAFIKWLGTVTYNCVLQYMSGQTVHPESIEEIREGADGESSKLPDIESDLHTEEAALTNMKRTGIREAIDLLPPDLKSVVLLKYYSGYKETEIAEIMRIPVGTVKTKLHKARAVLSKKLEKYASFMPLTAVMIYFNKEALLLGLGAGALVKSTVTARAAVPVLMAGAVLLSGLNVRNPVPTITKINISGEAYAVSDTVCAEISSSEAVRSVRIAETGEELTGTDKENTWRGSVTANGTYTIVMTDKNGISASQIFKVNNIDRTAPEIGEAVRTGENSCTVKISDAGSGIDWDGITVKDADGNLSDAGKEDKSNGTITFRLDELPLLLSVPDRADNRTFVRLLYE